MSAYEKLEITSGNLVNAIHGLQLMPEELKKAIKYAQLQAGKYARSASRISFQERTKIAQRSHSKRRTSGSKARAWLGGNPVPIRRIKGLARVKTGKITTKKGKTRVGSKVFVNNEYRPDLFVLNVPGQPVYRRVGNQRGDIEIVYHDIRVQTHQAAADVMPETKARLQTAFIERAEKLMGEGNTKRSLSSYKGQTQDRLSGAKYFRTTLR